jgi:hypothetical protein
MLKILAAAAIALASISLVACGTDPTTGLATFGSIDINLGNSKANSTLLAVSAKIDAGIAVVQADLPALCAIASSAAQVGAAASALSNNAKLAQVTSGASAAATSPICVNGVTGTVADATTLAASIKAVASAVNKPAASIAAPLAQ